LRREIHPNYLFVTRIRLHFLKEGVVSFDHCIFNLIFTGERIITDRSDDAQTKPTMNTVLDRINSLGNDLRDQIGELRGDLSFVRDAVTSITSDQTSLRNDLTSMASIQTSLRADLTAMASDQKSIRTDLTSLREEFHLFRGELEIRLDRIEGMTNQTRAEMLNLRADFREWRGQPKDLVT
jgi:chromosome segregation ATPase